MGLPFVALAAQFNGGVLLTEEQYIIGRMGGMTVRTFSFFYGFTQIGILGIVYGPLLQFDRVRMAASANLELGVNQKLFFFRAVGTVAVQAADPVCKRCVHSIFIECLIDHCLMAIPAQQGGFFSGLTGIGGCGVRMALFTFFLGHRYMNVIIQNSSFAGTMGAVAGITHAVGDLIIHVPFCKKGAVGLVALLAQCGHFFFQQIIGAGRGMRVVAAHTALSLLHRLVLEFNLIGPGADILVAFDTQCVAGFAENKAVIGTVSAVAGDAVAFDNHFVGTAGIIRDHVLMAPAAQRADIGDQKMLVGRRMRIMAGGAFSGLEQWMYRTFTHCVF